MAEPVKVSGKVVRDKFFTCIDEEKRLWKCICGTVCNQSGSSYTNLISHVRNVHGSSYAELVQDLNEASSTSHRSSQAAMTKIFYSSKTRNVYG